MTRIGLVILTGLALPTAAVADIGAAPALHNCAHDVVVHFDDFQLGPDDTPGESVTFTHMLQFEHPILGLTFSGWFDEPDGHDDGWASDMRLDILAPNGAMFSIGGYGAERAPNDWEFQGGMGAEPGYYVSTHWQTESGSAIFDALESMSGVWQFTFSNTFGTMNFHNWSNASLTFHMIPAPNGLALVACAGLAAMRRRR